MEITNDSLPWDSEDCAVLRTFFNTRTGQRFIPKLAESVPALLAKGDTNEICIRSGEVRGWQESLKAIIALTVPAPDAPKSQDNYPSLEDDSAHSDGQKLNE